MSAPEQLPTPRAAERAAGPGAVRALACGNCAGAVVYRATRTTAVESLGTAGIPDAATEYAKARAAWEPKLACLSCGHEEPLAVTDATVPSRAYTLADVESKIGAADLLPASVACPSCNSPGALAGRCGGGSCSSCGVTLIRADLPGSNWWRIDGVLPMLIDAETAKRRMLDECPFPRVRPKHRKLYAALELTPVYFPYVVFTADTVAEYAGQSARQKGFGYETDAWGKKSTAKVALYGDRQYVEGNWTGRLRVAVCMDPAAKEAEPRNLIDQRIAEGAASGLRVALPFDPSLNSDQAVPFTPEYVAGVPFDLPQGTLGQHWGPYRNRRWPDLKRVIELEELDGWTLFAGEQDVALTERREEYRVVLVPAWIGTVEDLDKRVWVDGSTGVPFVEVSESVLARLDPKRPGGSARLAIIAAVLLLLLWSLYGNYRAHLGR